MSFDLHFVPSRVEEHDIIRLMEEPTEADVDHLADTVEAVNDTIDLRALMPSLFPPRVNSYGHDWVDATFGRQGAVLVFEHSFDPDAGPIAEVINRITKFATALTKSNHFKCYDPQSGQFIDPPNAAYILREGYARGRAAMEQSMADSPNAVPLNPPNPTPRTNPTPRKPWWKLW